MFSRTIKAIAVASVIAGTTAATAYAYPHTGYQAQIDNQISSVIAGARGQGFNLIVANTRGQMYTGGGDVFFIVYLQAGADYRFAARCDSDCTDLDLSLRDANGRELMADRDHRRCPDLLVPRALHRRLPGQCRNGALPRLSLPGRRRGARPHHLIPRSGLNASPPCTARFNWRGPRSPRAWPAFSKTRTLPLRHFAKPQRMEQRP